MRLDHHGGQAHFEFQAVFDRRDGPALAQHVGKDLRALEGHVGDDGQGIAPEQGRPAQVDIGDKLAARTPGDAQRGGAAGEIHRPDLGRGDRSAGRRRLGPQDLLRLVQGLGADDVGGGGQDRGHDHEAAALLLASIGSPT
ncbi:hypothetical protein [Paracoccus sp. S3-43]|uniref:hypothetical protein n=1 Tax=Paracoccus sp. S3-43 TaxID=3030011 RepID=UPI0023B1E1DF|nr:hypothetical protein [Paracoccus sp. S3-43]WEF23024.1 hypothetical protein PXD02_09240 [Paracoccus sp. S3-43]